MRKLIIGFALCSFSSLALANSQLPPPDFSSVGACFSSMNNDYFLSGDYMEGFFYGAMDETAGSMQFGTDGVFITRTSLCRIVSRTNDGDWVRMNPYISDAFIKTAQDQITKAVQNYNTTGELGPPLYFTISCPSQKNKNDMQCTGSVVQ